MTKPLSPRHAGVTQRSELPPGTGRHQRGQSLVEFAMVTPLLFLIVCGVFEFGNILLTQLQIQNAVREAARYAALGGCNSTSAQIQSKARTVSNNLAISTTVTYYNPYPTASACSNCANVGAGSPEVAVAGTYTYNAITPVGGFFRLFGGTFNNALTLTSTSTMNNEC